MSDQVTRWLFGISSLGLLGALVLLGIGHGAGSAQDSAKTVGSTFQAGPAQVTAGSADWPMPLYDSGRTRANLQELAFSAPFDPTPVKVLTYTVGEAMRPAAITDSDMLFWYKTDESSAGDELVVATDLNGQKLWSFDIPAGFSLYSVPPVVAGEEVFVAEYGKDDSSNFINNVVALDRQTGSFLWRRPTHVSTILAVHTRPSLPIAVQDGIAYLSWWQDSIWNGFLTAVNARTGAVIWEITPANNGGSVAEALAITNDVLVALHYTHIVGYDLATGSELWEFDVSDATGWVQDVEDMVAVGGKVAFANTRIVGALDVTDGSTIWSHLIDVVSCDPYAVSAMASDGNDLFIMGMCRYQLRKYDLDTGIELWRETVDETEGHIALANNVVYVNARDIEDLTGFISAHSAESGQFLQRLDVSSLVDDVGLGYIPHAESFAVANGQLMAMVPGTVSATRWKGTLFFWQSNPNDYLPLYNDDGSPDTNPDAEAEVSIIDIDGVYGAEIQVAAQIGGLTATLRVYHAGGGLYKEGSTEADEFGNGFWIVPLEYAGSGYEYQVILNDGSELARRQVLMPADAAAGVDYFIQSDGLSWVSPPAIITSVSYTLTLSLPGGFPITTTNTFAMLQSSGGGSLLIPGVRAGNEVLIRLDENNAINGEHTFTAAASAGNVTAYSPILTVTVDAPTLPTVRAEQIVAFQPNSDGSVSVLSVSFDRRRFVVDSSVQADAQIADIFPNPSGYEVLLWVKTPPEDPLDPRTSKWEVGVLALDEGGNELNRSSAKIPAAPDGRYLILSVVQPGSRPIASLAAFGSILESESAVYPQSREAVAFPGISFPSDIDPDDIVTSCLLPDSPTPILNLEFLSKPTDALENLEKLHAEASHLTANTIHVSGTAARFKPEPGTDLYDAVGGPLSDVTCRADGRGSSDWETIPPTPFDFRVAESRKGRRVVSDDWRRTGPDGGGLEEWEIDFSHGPAFVRYSASKTERWVTTCVPNTVSDPGCCYGELCSPGGTLAGPPGADHPDDTNSVVLQNEAEDDTWNYWRGVAAYANSRGFTELAAFARFHLLELSYLEVIDDFPAGVVLSEEQQQVVNDNENFRLFSSAELLDQRGTIAAQLDQLEAEQANVLANGYYGEMQAMLSFYGIPNRLISPDFSPDAITGSLIVIPTAGLYGLEADTVFAERLARFVERGGTLLVMTQPGNQSINLLPGTWDQVDYQSEESCFMDAMTLVEFHPVLASVSEPTFTSHVDGYMTTIPGSAQLLMERTKNQQGAFVFYEHGLGQMIVTNMYEDWGRTVGHSTQQVRDLFRDVVRWASLDDQALPEVGPYAPVQLTVDVENVTFQDAAKLQWVVRDPNGLEVDSGLAIQDLALSPGQTSQQIVNFTPGDNTLGIWSLNYELLDSEEAVVQGETQAGYFIVKDPPPLDFLQEPTSSAAPFTPGATETEVALSLDQVAYQPGETVTATFTISLTDPGAVSGLKVVVSLGESTLEQILPAVANQQVVFNLPADFSNNGLFFYGVYDSTAGEGLYLNTRWMQPAGTGVTIVPASPTYTPDQNVTLNISGNFTRTIFVEGADFARSIDVSSTITVAFDLPAVLSSGPVLVQYEDSGFMRTARFDIIGPRLTVKGMNTNQSLIAPGGVADVYATIESDQALDVLIAGHIVDGDGFLFPTVYLTTTLVPGQQTLTMTMPISTSTSGSVHYQMEILDAAKTAVSYVQAHRFFTIDAPALQSVRAAGGPTVPSDKPEVSLDWYAPSAANLDVTLWLDGQAVITETITLPGGFTTTDLTIPGELALGVYELYAEADLSDGVTTSAHGTLTVETASRSAFYIYLPLVNR